MCSLRWRILRKSCLAPDFRRTQPGAGASYRVEDHSRLLVKEAEGVSPTRIRNAAAALLLGAALLARPVGALAEKAGTPPPAPDNVAAADNAATVAVDNAAEAGPGPSEPSGPAGEAGAEEPSPTVADPLEPVNRAIFVVNDRAYFWVMKPVAQGYRAVVPQGVRVSVRNFFSNLGTPIRLANNLLQGKPKGAGTELLRFVINSTIGIAGLFDPAKTGFHIEKRNEDLGQTLGRYGLGQGFYVVLPILGPSTARDTVGLAGDLFADPLTYIGDPWAATGVRVFKSENEVSLSIGDYEDLKESSLDPYVAVRDAYVQNRAKKVRE